MKLLRCFMLLLPALALMINGLIASTASAATTYVGPVFTVMNTSETLPDGVWFRRSPHTPDTDKVTGHGVYMNEQVQLECYAWGDAVGPYNNKLWYFALNETRPVNNGVSNSGYLNAHYVNDGKLANQIDAGVPQCGATPPYTIVDGVNVGFAQNTQHTWGANCVIQDFKGGTYGWVIVGYSNGTNIVRNGLLFGWFDNGGGPGLGCPTNQEYGYSDGVRQDFTHGSLYWASGMNHALRVTWRGTWSPIWSGYAGVSTNVTYVHSSWTVPAVNCASVNGPSYESSWAGIDGLAGSRNLVQAGSGSDCSSSSAPPSYYIWWEKIPNNPNKEVRFPAAVHAGDLVSVDISYGMNKQFTIVLTLNGVKQKPVVGTLAGSHVSGECIVEAPDVNKVDAPLADFGQSSFSSCLMAKQGVAPFPVVAATANGTALWRVDMRHTSTSPLRATPGLPRSPSGAWSVLRRGA